MRRFICAALAALYLTIPALAVETLPEESFSLSCTAAVLMEAQTGTVLYEKEAHRHLSPASVTKIMTLLLVAEAVESGHKVKVGRLVVGTMPRAKLLGRTTGLMKAVVDADTGLVLGAQLFCSESQELINMIKIAMDAGLPYTVLRDGIYTHPTMSEGMNDLFAI